MAKNSLSVMASSSASVGSKARMYFWKWHNMKYIPSGSNFSLSTLNSVLSPVWKYDTDLMQRFQRKSKSSSSKSNNSRPIILHVSSCFGAGVFFGIFVEFYGPSYRVLGWSAMEKERVNQSCIDYSSYRYYFESFASDFYQEWCLYLQETPARSSRGKNV